ncbi:hypothetical protein DN062_16530 [Nitrincola tibetensis]|uniref:Oxidoreductase n=1 Tax=Nitrincola tibetensis TaxID=2219697 RepID=A0A364NI33_9GAMM|nr:DUF934 domain-containing protein [Nitrincola tibetensis]RAU16736.1 hypothetical protein DN062_16530 [Nitrincola tibetensis]
MPLIINREKVQDSWALVSPEEGADFVERASGHELLLVPFDCLEVADALGSKQLGVQVTGEVEVEQLVPWLSKLSLIAIEFPVFRDGRGFSLARQLRRVGYTGELRAVGDVGRDRLGYLERCGFNAFLIAEEAYSDELLQAFSEISVHYQGSADDPRPIYHQ